MQLVRQVQFKRSKLLDEITFLSKNLFNVATYTVRQRFFVDRHWTRYNELWRLLKSHKAYKKLQEMCGSHPPQQVLKQVDRNFKSFFKAMRTFSRLRSTPSFCTIVLFKLSSKVTVLSVSALSAALLRAVSCFGIGTGVFRVIGRDMINLVCYYNKKANGRQEKKEKIMIIFLTCTAKYDTIRQSKTVMIIESPITKLGQGAKKDSVVFCARLRRSYNSQHLLFYRTLFVNLLSDE